MTHLSTNAITRLSQELKHIDEVLLPAARDDLVASKDAGDNAENVDFFVALDHEAQITARKIFIEQLLRTSTTADVDLSVVSPGVIVTLDFGFGGEEFVFGHIEEASTVDCDVITPESPLGVALHGARPDDTVSYDANGRDMNVTVVAIRST